MWVRKLGDKYRKGKMQISATSSIEEFIKGEEKVYEETLARDKAKAAKSGTADDKPDYDWSGTEDGMREYHNAMFKAWRKKKQGFSLDNLGEAMGDLFNAGTEWLKRKFM